MLYDDERYAELFAAMKEIVEKSTKFSSVDQSGISEALRQISRLQTIKPDLSPLIETFQRISLAEHPSYRNSILQMQQFSQSLKKSLAVSDELQQSIVGVLRSAGKYMDEEQKAVVDEIDPEILNPSKERRSVKPLFSPKTLYAIFTLLFALIGIIVQRLPSEQLDEISSQNRQIIALDEKIVQQNSEEITLLIQLNETCQKIVDLLENNAETDSLVTDELESVTDIFTDPDQGLIDSPEPDSAPDSQQEKADAVE